MTQNTQNNEKNSSCSIDKYLENIIVEIFKKLEEIKLIEFDENQTVKILAFGNKMSKNYVYYETMKTIFLVNENTEEYILETLSNSVEFNKYRSKLEDRKSLNFLNKEIKYCLKGAIDSYNKKAYVLIQAVFSNLKIDQWELIRQQNEIITSSSRIINCFKEKYKSCNDGVGYINCLIIKRSILRKMWNDSDLITRQLPKIGEKLARNLLKAGINTFDKLILENPRKIEATLAKNAPFGNILIDVVKSIPIIDNYKYEITKVFNKQFYKIHIQILIPYNRLVTNSNNSSYHDDFEPYTCYKCILVDCKNNILLKKKLKPNSFLKPTNLNFQDIKKEQFPIAIHLICEKFIGLDKSIIIKDYNDHQGNVYNKLNFKYMDSNNINNIKKLLEIKGNNNNNNNCLSEQLQNNKNNEDHIMEDDNDIIAAVEALEQEDNSKNLKKSFTKTKDKRKNKNRKHNISNTINNTSINENDIKTMINKMNNAEEEQRKQRLKINTISNNYNNNTDKKSANKKLEWINKYVDKYENKTENRDNNLNNISDFNSLENINFNYLNNIADINKSENKKMNNINNIKHNNFIPESKQKIQGNKFGVNWDDLL